MPVDLRELRRLERSFSDVRAQVAGLSGMLADRLSKSLNVLDAGQNRQVFKRETDPTTGRRWRRLSPKYLAWKKRNSRSRKVLVLGGQLKKSLTTTRGAGRVAYLRQSVMTLGTVNPLGAIHMQGNDNLPERPMVGKTRPQMRALTAAVRKQVMDAVGRSLGGRFGRDIIKSAARIKPDPRRF
jgi:phage gpG-like protein